jgi:hypothetical protein
VAFDSLDLIDQLGGAGVGSRNAAAVLESAGVDLEIHDAV